MKTPSMGKGSGDAERPFRAGPLFTDLYELTMAACYRAEAMEKDAVFSLYVRDFPENRNYLVAAGLEDVLTELSRWRFQADEIAYLRSTGLFNDDFLNYLKTLRFTGDVFALPEGTFFFPDEPLLEVRAPVMQAQMLETYLLNTVGYQTLIASKAVRCVEAAKDRDLVDFSMRRTHGFDAGLKTARSAYLAGFSATSNVLAGKRYGIPVSGTMAHSFVMAFEREETAFSTYADVFPGTAVFLIDTYDTLEGARCAARVGRRMQEKGRPLLGVRLDSGDMPGLSRKVRKILDDAGLTEVKIFASSGLDENAIAEILAKKGKIDAFGVGTKMGVSADAPYLDIVYKLVRYDGRHVRKYSPGKRTLAGEKQVFRRIGKSGKWTKDVIGRREEHIPGTVPLLIQVMDKGTRTSSPPDLNQIRKRVKENRASLPARYRSLYTPRPYPVLVSDRLTDLQKTAVF